MIGNLIQELCPSIAAIALENDREIVEEHKSNSFGDALVVLKSEDFLTQVTRDRGELAISIWSLSLPRKWIDPKIIFEFIGEVHASGELDDVLRSFTMNRRKIAALMTSDIHQLESFERKHAGKSINRIFPPE